MLTLTKYVLILVILLPYLIIFSLLDVDDINLPTPPLMVFYKTFLQAFFSAFMALLIGLCGALGLLRYKNKALEMWVLLPSFFPALFVIFALLTIFSALPYAFPYGLSGIVIAHIVTYSGLVSVLLARVFKESCGLQVTLAKCFGHSNLSILWYILLPYTQRDICTVFLMLFCLCWSSFSIPLVLGGGQWITTEMAIYELIRFEGDLTSSAFLSLYQVIVLLCFMYFIPHAKDKKITNDPQIGFKFLIILPISITLGLLGVCLLDIFSSFNELLFFTPFVFLKAFSGTLLVSGLTGLFILLFLQAIAYVGPNYLLDRFYLLFILPSTAVIGFSLLFLSYMWQWDMRFFLQPIILTAMGLSLLFLGGLYRWKWSGEILRLASQRQLARLMGHGPWSIFLHIVWPQSKYLAWQLAGVAAFWAAGDFALSLMLFKDSDATLGLLLNSMMASYKIKGASWILLCMLLSGVLMWYCLASMPKITNKFWTDGTEEF